MLKVSFADTSFKKATLFLEGRRDRRIKFGAWRELSEAELRMTLFSSLASGGTRGEIIQMFTNSTNLKKIVNDNTLTTYQIARLLKASNIRFPNLKARRIMANRKVRIKWMLEDLSAFSGKTLQHERWARLALKSELPGMGFKEVSNFLKWSGFSKYLSVLDSINLNFLKWAGAIPISALPGHLADARLYYALENWQNELADRLGITVSELDNLIVFDWVHSKKTR